MSRGIKCFNYDTFYIEVIQNIFCHSPPPFLFSSIHYSIGAHLIRYHVGNIDVIIVVVIIVVVIVVVTIIVIG